MKPSAVLLKDIVKHEPIDFTAQNITFSESHLQVSHIILIK